MKEFTVALVVFSALYLAAGVLIFGRRKAGYRQIQHTISELGEVGAPCQREVALRVFLPVGLAVLLAAALLQARSPAAAALALCIAVGYLVAVAFPCDPGSPVSGTTRQSIHNLGGAVQYLGGSAALLSLAAAQNAAVFRLLGITVFGATILLAILPAKSVRGLVQRVAELALFAGLAMAAASSS